MTNSKIRNFFETLRSIKEDALLPYEFILSENQMKSLYCRQTKILNFRTLHFKRSNVYIFCFDIRLCDLQIRKIKKQNKKHLN